MSVDRSDSARSAGIKPPRCLVVVPAFNEGRSVGAVVRAVLNERLPVLVVDDGSEDDTAAVAEQAGADVLRLPANVGVGAALQAGFRFAVSHGYDVVVQCDGDGQHRPHEIQTLLARMQESGAALVIGTRFTDPFARRALPFARRVAMQVLASIASRRAGVRLTDASSGFRAIRVPLLAEFAREYPAEYLGDTVEAIILAGRAGHKVIDVEVGMDERQSGRSSASTVAASWYVLRVLAAILLGAGSQSRNRGTAPRLLVDEAGGSVKVPAAPAEKAADRESQSGTSLTRGRRGPTAATAMLAGVAVLAILALARISRSVLDEVGFLGAAGSERLVAGAAVLFAVAVLAAGTLPQRLLRIHTVAVTTALAFWALSVMALSDVLLDGLLAGATGVACYATGRWVTSRLGLRDSVTWPVELTAGAGLLAVAVLLLGRVGLLSAWTVGLAVLLLPLLLASSLLRRRDAAAAVVAARLGWSRLLDALTASRVGAGAYGCLAVVAGAALVWTSAPEIQFDAVYAKAWLPAQWAAAGRIGPSLDHPVLNLTGASQLLAVPAHTLGAPAVGRFLQLLATAAIATALWQWGGRTGSTWRGPVAALVVALTPHVVWQASTAYDDAILALFALSVSMAAVLLPAAERPFASGLLLGLAGGACVAGKLHLAPFAALLLAAWVLVQHGGFGRLRALAGVAAGGAAIALPGPLLSWAATGNPVFPQYNAVFRSRHYPPVNEQYNFPYSPDGSLSALLRAPWDAVREPSRYVEAVPPGGFGLLPLLLVAAALVGWMLGRRWLPVWLAIVLATAYWWMSFRYLRYALPTMVVSVALLTHAWPRTHRLPAVRGRAALAGPLAALVAMAVLAVAHVPSTLASFWNIPERFPMRVALGLADRDVHQDVLAGAAVLKRFNQLGRPGDVLVGGLHARTLLDQELDLTPTWELATVLSTAGPTPEDPQRLRDLARERGVNWATVSAGGDLSTTSPLVADLVGAFGIPVFAADNVVLFQLAESPVAARPSRPAPLCDPGFVGGATCWGPPLDLVSGLASPEAPGGVSQAVPACAGGTYRGTVEAAASGGSVRIMLSTDVPQGRTSLADALPGTAARAVLTAPEGATTVNVYVAAFGPGVAQRVSLERVDSGPDC